LLPLKIGIRVRYIGGQTDHERNACPIPERLPIGSEGLVLEIHYRKRDFSYAVVEFDESLGAYPRIIPFGALESIT
jgi:hypothetical protein